MHPEGIGQSVLRREDHRLLIGKGQFVADIVIEGMRHCAFVRSPHAHAIVKSVDAGAALQSPGCVAVFTGMDMKAAGVDKMTPLWLIPGVNNTRLIEPPRWSMAQDRVRHVGEIVAVVVAHSLNQALDAAELVEVNYEALPCVVEVSQAGDAQSPRIHEEAPGNQKPSSSGAASRKAISVKMPSAHLDSKEELG